MILTQSDREALARLLKSPHAVGAPPAVRARLAGIVDGATVVPPEAVPSGVVTMSSVVRLIDIMNGEIVRYAIVHPSDANVDRLKISVLAPLGVALIGRAEGDIIEMAVPAGTRRFYLQKVEFQPESRFRASVHDATGETSP
jgi:regulator of nucleoside diphosphate kinase